MTNYFLRQRDLTTEINCAIILIQLFGRKGDNMATKPITPPPATKELVERLAELEGITPKEMMMKMAGFYGAAVSFLYEEGMTPAAFNKYLLGFRQAVLEQGMKAIGEALHGEDRTANAPPVQHMGKRKFVMPGPATIVAGHEDDLAPSPPALPEPAQRKVS